MRAVRAHRRWVALVVAYALAIQMLLTAVAGAGQMALALSGGDHVLCLSGADQAPADRPASREPDCCTWACNSPLPLVALPEQAVLALREPVAAGVVAPRALIVVAASVPLAFDPRAPPVS